MRLIFLDIDGVLNNILDHKISLLLCGEPTEYKVEISQNNFDILKYLTTLTNSHIVISSSWRKSPMFNDHENEFVPTKEIEIVEKFKKLFSHFGWGNAPIIGITPNIAGFRGEEVATYLDSISKIHVIEDYIILDDDSDFILDKLADLSTKFLEHSEIDLNKKYSSYWEHQRLILVNRLVGLAYSDLIEILKIWAPESDMIKVHESYQPYIPRYGKKFK